MLRLLVWLLSQPLCWALAGVAGGPYLFFRGFRTLQLKRRIMNTPRSSIRSAAIGPVEVSGTAMGPYTLIAPMSHCECLYYRLVVESNPRGDLGKRIHEMCAPLFLNDGTGTLMIYPQGAELRMSPSCQRAEYGAAVALLATRYSRKIPEFSQEYTIKPGDKVFVLGTILENRWARSCLTQESDLSRIGPGFVGDAEADLQRRDAFPFLETSVPAGATVQTEEQFDLNPAVMMVKGNGPFIISSDNEHELLTKLGWKSLLCIWGGPLAALVGLWVLLIVRPGLIGSPLMR